MHAAGTRGLRVAERLRAGLMQAFFGTADWTRNREGWRVPQKRARSVNGKPN